MMISCERKSVKSVCVYLKCNKVFFFYKIIIALNDLYHHAVIAHIWTSSSIFLITNHLIFNMLRQYLLLKNKFLFKFPSRQNVIICLISTCTMNLISFIARWLYTWYHFLSSALLHNSLLTFSSRWSFVWKM